MAFGWTEELSWEEEKGAETQRQVWHSVQGPGKTRPDVREGVSRSCAEGLVGWGWDPGARMIPEEGLAVRMAEG